MKRYFVIISYFLSYFFLWHGAMYGVDTFQISSTQITRLRGAAIVDLEKCYGKIVQQIGSVDGGTCCDSVLGILGDICEILGPDSTVSGTLRDLCEMFSNVSTSVMIAMDFDDIFTIIDDIEENLCDKFEGLFTLLETFTNEEQRFNNVFTLLDTVCDKLENVTGTLSLIMNFNAVFTAINEVEETLCDKFEGLFTVLDEILIDNTEGFNATFTILDGICNKLLTLTIALIPQVDFDGVYTVIDGIEENLCDKFEGVFTAIERELLCDPIPLTQDDVVGGVITLDIEGLNFCLAENIVGDIEITGNNINLDMNNRVLFGVILIDADEVIVENGKIRPAAPPDQLSADIGAVTIASENIVLRDLLIVCADTTVANVIGRAGIENNGDKTQIIDCSIKSGSAFGSNNVTPVNGGSGILNFGDNLIVTHCVIETGFGGSELVGGAAAGAGGIGIQCEQSGKAIIQNTIIQTGFGGNGGGQGGDGIFAIDGSFVIQNCKIVTGDGGLGVPRGGAGQSMNFFVNVQEVIIDNCDITVGFNGTVFRSGIFYQGNSLFKVSNSCIITGSANISANGISALSTFCNELSHITIKTGNSTVTSGIGIEINAPGIVDHCTIRTGNAASSAAGGGIIPTSSTEDEVNINNCTIYVGNSGVSGGDGISASIISSLIVDKCFIQIGESGSVKGNGIGGLGNGLIRCISNTVIVGAFDGIQFVAAGKLVAIKNCKAIQCTRHGFSVDVVAGMGPTRGVICENAALQCDGDGFLIGTGAQGFQIVSNKAVSNGGIGFNNTSVMPATVNFYNNVASMNVGGNFVGIANVEATPADDTGFYANVIT